MMERATDGRPATGALFVLLALLVPGAATAATDAATAPQTTCHRLAVTHGDRPLVGIEDMDRLPDGRLLLSAYDRRAHEAGKLTVGGLYLLDPAALDGTAAETLALTETNEAGMLPHGIAVLADDRGTRILAIDRRPADGPVVQVLDLKDGRVVERTTLRHPHFCRANDLAVLDRDRFLFTRDRDACDGFAGAWETVVEPRGGRLMLYDGGRVAELARGIAFANGVLVDPAADTVTVAATRDAALLRWPLSTLLRGEAPEPARIALPGGPDNLTAGPGGRVLTALHPALFQLARHRHGWPFGDRAPSMLVAVDGTTADAATLAADDGRLFPAATVAMRVDDRLVAGSVTAAGLWVCPLGKD